MSSNGQSRDGRDGQKRQNSRGDGRGRQFDRRGSAHGSAHGFGREQRSSGRAGTEAAILGILREIERPLVAGDFAAQKPHLLAILERVKQANIKSLEDLEFDCRTRLFTMLLRAGRQPANSDSAKEELRKDILVVLGDIWRAAKDERRSDMLYEAAGRSEPVARLLEESGKWQEAAALHRKDGRPLEAARLYNDHGEWKNALETYREGGDAREWLRVALRLGESAEIGKAALKIPVSAAREILLKNRRGDLLLEVLAVRGEWKEIGQLYERAEQWEDAASAYEKGDLKDEVERVRQRISGKTAALDNGNQNENRAETIVEA